MSSDQVKACEREISVRQDQIDQLQVAIDQAAEGSDQEAIRSLQAELSSTQVMLESARRRLEKAKAGATEQEKEAIRKANLAAVETVMKSLQADIAKAEAIEKTLQTLSNQIIDLIDGSRPAAAEFSKVFKVLPLNRRSAYMPLTNAVCTHDYVPSRIEHILARTDKFHLRFQLTDTPPLGECYRARAEKLARTAMAAAESVNAEVR